MDKLKNVLQGRIWVHQQMIIHHYEADLTNDDEAIRIDYNNQIYQDSMFMRKYGRYYVRSIGIRDDKILLQIANHKYILPSRYGKIRKQK